MDLININSFTLLGLAKKMSFSAKTGVERVTCSSELSRASKVARVLERFDITAVPTFRSNVGITDSFS
jgi:hypothetical protein